LLATYLPQAPLLYTWLHGIKIIIERHLRLQYLASMSLNSDMGARGLSSVLERYRFPERTLVGLPENTDALKPALDRRNDWRQCVMSNSND
jgi:hypothetical protein